MRTFGKRFEDSLTLLSPAAAASSDKIPKVSYIDNEPDFRWELLQEQMAFDKLHEGIKKFAEDADTLRGILKERIQK